MIDPCTGKTVVLCRGCGIDLSDGTAPVIVVKVVEEIWRNFTSITTIQPEDLVFCETCHACGCFTVRQNGKIVEE